MNTPGTENPPEPPVAYEQRPAARKFHWPGFTLALLLPAVVTFATAAAGWNNFPIACAFIGAGLSGLACGILLGNRLGKTAVAAFALSIVFICAFAMLSFALCFGGCLLGGAQAGFH